MRKLYLSFMMLVSCQLFAQEPVDLGLSVWWGSKNVGAASPYDIGEYFAWGETREKHDYCAENYFDSEWDSQLKVSGMKMFNSKGEKTLKGNPSYDAAAKKLGGFWRMPTPAEFRELAHNCTLNFIHDNDRNKYYWEIIAENGKSIIIPISKHKDNTTLHGYGTFLWTSKMDEEDVFNAYVMNFDKNYAVAPWAIQTLRRYYGVPIRPVFDYASAMEHSDKPNYKKLGKALNLQKSGYETDNPSYRFDYFEYAEKAFAELEAIPNIEEIISKKTINAIRDELKDEMKSLNSSRFHAAYDAPTKRIVTRTDCRWCHHVFTEKEKEERHCGKCGREIK